VITLYETEWCPDSHRIRQLLTELRLTYTAVNVAADREQRPEVVAVSGQSGVPVLVDGDKVYADPDDALEYLRTTYPRPDDAGRQAAMGAWRRSKTLSVAPRVALARLAELLLAKELSIVSRLEGPQLDPRLPDEYTMLHVGAPAAIARTFELDPAAPVALLVPVAVIPAEGGGSVVAMADPVGQVWLYGEPDLRRVQAAVKQRLFEVLQEL
jgi:glutaredoxin 3